jgi:energy-coupling factor transport system substrate-specific component
MSKKVVSIKTVVATGIGAAIFFVLMRFVAIPSGVPNTQLQLGSAILALFAAVFGPVAGLLIGLIGHALVDLTWGGIWWSWVVADAIFGLLVGLLWKFYKIEDGEFGVKQCVIFNIAQIAANAVAWLVIAPLGDILIYAEPSDKVFLQGAVAGGLNSAVILVLGSLLAAGYSRTRVKKGSLRTE